ncbi:MAG TPA: hypothetical protein DEA22_09010 [Blastocatellia bacterium]|nr:hypothetical protein [Blastocatellia bacterium]
MTRNIHGVEVHGIEVDGETRCGHWHGAEDIIAIKFKCCGKWFPCFECHSAEAGHPAQTRPNEEFDEQAVLCGNCGRRLTVNQYLRCHSRCPDCNAGFNPRCANHYHLYFEIGKGK